MQAPKALKAPPANASERNKLVDAYDDDGDEDPTIEHDGSGADGSNRFSPIDSAFDSDESLCESHAGRQLAQSM